MCFQSHGRIYFGLSCVIYVKFVSDLWFVQVRFCFSWKFFFGRFDIKVCCLNMDEPAWMHMYLVSQGIRLVFSLALYVIKYLPAMNEIPTNMIVVYKLRIKYVSSIDLT